MFHPSVLPEARAFDARRHRKDHQLCRQVRDCLSYALAGLDDPRLQALVLEDVSPAPDASRLKVSLRLVDLPPVFTESEVRSALAGASGLLRWEVAQAISRRRAPELFFDLIH